MSMVAVGSTACSDASSADSHDPPAALEREANLAVTPPAESAPSGDLARSAVARFEPVCETTPRSDAFWSTVGDYSLVWNGEGHGIAWADYGSAEKRLFFARLDANGKQIGSATTVATNFSYGNKLVFNGTEYGLAFATYRSGGRVLEFVRFDASGKLLGEPLHVTLGEVYGDLDLVYADGQYAVVWRENRRPGAAIALLRIDANGQKIGNEIVLRHRSEFAHDPTIVATNDAYGVAWADARHGNGDEVYFTRVSKGGAILGTEQRITDNEGQSELPVIAWSGSQYGLFYSQRLDPTSMEERFVALDSNGQRVGSERLVAGNVRSYGRVKRAIWTGTEYSVAFGQTDGVGIHRIAPDGTATAPRKLLGPGLDPTFAWSGSSYRAIWRVPASKEQFFDLRISPDLCP
ncbi:hypothetical protein [Pendulispora albinea]|uniref:Uncharacterized protein n=1 Tax=Pendulispora albinea TaxID=2741071 RepID=A0ABZ2LVV2_9BACT